MPNTKEINMSKLIAEQYIKSLNLSDLILLSVGNMVIRCMVEADNTSGFETGKVSFDIMDKYHVEASLKLDFEIDEIDKEGDKDA